MTEQVTAAFAAHFGAGAVHAAERQTALEDFGGIPDAFGVPYTFWLIGGVDPETYRAAVENGTVARDIPANHSPFFAPVMDPTLGVGSVRTSSPRCPGLGGLHPVPVSARE
ncbi:hypothetical protein [Pseudarthrobacter sulfonivorans]|uniref:hypothetical protein n=1 Tax=Pseudarthrobacter sulfonivorans TaxID=121292 RepID=UPI00285C385F|nr:hypothetical protein [Pseudarthrobacter sulfonivorans]MDR6413325.1 hypothetical protein [Pseudarthrobacter sulfonivorans]